MATNPKYSNEAVNAEADALRALYNTGYLRIYTGSQPASADAATGAVTLLAELRFGATAFAAATAGLITASAITADTAADNTGTAAWFRALKSDGSSPLNDGSVGTATSDLILNSVSIQSGAQVSVTSVTVQVSKG